MEIHSDLFIPETHNTVSVRKLFLITFGHLNPALERRRMGEKEIMEGDKQKNREYLHSIS
jgi:hypothetical protein